MFPDDIFSPRVIENRPGVVYDADNTKTLYAEDIDAINNEIIAIEQNTPVRGWFILNTSPTRQSVDAPNYVLRFNADMTEIFSLGQRLKITQNGTIRYFIVVAVGSFTGGNTDVTVYGGTDYAVLDTATYPITLPFVSNIKAPFGFPLSPEKWSITSTGSGQQLNPTSGQWYNKGGNIVIPIGSWRLGFRSTLFMNGSASDHVINMTLASANNAAGVAQLTMGKYTGVSVVNMHGFLCAEWPVTVSVKTTFYRNCRVIRTGVTQLYDGIEGNLNYAICAYL
ncbi:MAG: hypothetical protein WAV16_02070 [Candidatus Moraniibacteriota bacterium]